MANLKQSTISDDNRSSETTPLLIGLCSPSMGSGKTTFAEALVRQHGFERIAIASTLKAMGVTYLKCLGINEFDAWELISDPELKEGPMPELGGKSPRYMMQTLGTEWGRTCFGPDFWIDTGIRKALGRQNDGVPVVIDDVRFLNEADAIRKAGGFVVRVIRPGIERPTGSHASEGELDTYPVDAQIINDSTPEVLKAQVPALIRALSMRDTRCS